MAQRAVSPVGFPSVTEMHGEAQPQVPDDGDESLPWLVIGLGNPGPGYVATYHNVGFRVVEILARRWGVLLAVNLGPARIARLRNEVETVLVQPQTYMNCSGVVLGALFERFGAESRLVVVSDDLALPLGRIRIRERGSAGGHNGLKSISSAYGSDDYLRVRVGIDSDRPVEDARDYVLSEVRKTDRSLLEKAEHLAADAVEHIVQDGVLSAMADYNGLDLREQA